MLNIVLVEPEIPQNCATSPAPAPPPAAACIWRPLGFDISEKPLRRAGLDYWHLVEVFDYENFGRAVPAPSRSSGKRPAHHHQGPPQLSGGRFHTGQLALFSARRPPAFPRTSGSGSMTGASDSPHGVRGPQFEFSNTVAVCVYEALRQTVFPDCRPRRRWAKA